MIPAHLEIRARELVLDAIRRGGELWKHVSPATIEMMVEAVAMDLVEHGGSPDVSDGILSDDQPHR